MTAERWASIKALFERANELPPAEHAAWLRAQCSADEALYGEVAALLAVLPKAAGFIETPALQQHAAEYVADGPANELLGRQLGHYLIEAEIGRGGMGEVYRAVDQRLGRTVALKVLPAEFAAEAARVRRFEREARTISALKHPNIVTLFELLSHEGRQVIVMELIEGETLREVLKRGPLDWREVVRIGAQMAAALAAAHSVGIIHRDIKPANVIRQTGQAAGHVKVLDFGIAKMGGEFVVPPADGSGSPAEIDEAIPPVGGATNAPPTTTAALLGTPGYLSPEQARGEAQAQPDVRTDIFALGVVLFELLTGRLPFPGATAEDKLAAVLSATEAPDVREFLPALPAALSAILVKALRKDRAQRFATGGELHADLEELKNDLAGNNPVQVGAQLKVRNANRLLTQFTILHLNDPTTRIPPARLWAIGRYSDLKRGEPEGAVLRRSWLTACWKTLRVALPVGLVTLALAAWFSVTEQWGERVMHDGHARRVTKVVLSPDGKKLVSVGFDKQVIVWDLARRARLATLNEHKDVIAAAAFSPDGKWFATMSSGHDCRAVIWDAERLTKVTEMPGGPRDHVSSIAFTPNGRLFGGPGDPDKKDTRNVWEVGTWRKLAALNYNSGFLFSPDSRWQLGGDWQTFDLSSGSEVAKGAGQPFGEGALSPDGTRLAGLDAGGFVSFWDVSRFWKTGERRLLNRLLAHRDHGHAIAYSPDGRLVASASENIILWEARTHEKLARFTAKDTVNDVIFTCDSRQIISAHGDGAIIIWDIAEKAQVANLAEHSGPVYAASFSPDGQAVLSASEDNSVFIWDAASGLKRAVLTGHNAPVKSAEFSRDGQWAVTSDLSHNVKVWDAATGAQLRSFALPRKDDTLFNYTAALSPDKRWVATTFGVYDTNAGHTVVEYSPQTKPAPAIRGLAFSSDGRWLACAGTTAYLALWEVGTWRLRQELSLGGNFNTVTFSRDNRSLVVGDNGGVIQLWQVEPLKLIDNVGKAGSGTEGFSFAPDGRVLAVASDNETLSLWDVMQRRHLRDVGQHILPVLAVGFAPDGRRLVTGEQDNSVRVYTRQRTLWGWRLD